MSLRRDGVSRSASLAQLLGVIEGIEATSRHLKQPGAVVRRDVNRAVRLSPRGADRDGGQPVLVRRVRAPVELSRIRVDRLLRVDGRPEQRDAMDSRASSCVVVRPCAASH